MFKVLLQKIIRRLSRLLAVEADKYVRISYSQGGEDLIINTIFTLRGIQRPSYLDIGANHPYKLNNTAIFYLRGARGINIEANPNLINLFNKARPDDINLNIGIGIESGQMNFYIMEDDTLSTFSLEESERMQALGNKLQGICKVDLITVDEVIEKYTDGKFPDLLTIDVEGYDFMILQTIDFNRFRPKVICLEAAEYSPIGAGERRHEMLDFLINKNYYEYANTNLNAIMVDRAFWFI